ncbi:MAG TPA: hypothetical protein ENI20_14945 [Bacteroides sp.]|nr:hypothetical protein [Bacteroides sp.]
MRKRVMFSIVSIIPDGDVIAQGKSVNITATFSITGSTNEPGPSVVWESDLGTFESSNLVSTIWTAPKDFIGDAKIKLTATFMGHTDIAERVVRIVKTPAAGWGSLSGYVHNANNNPLSNVIIVTSTGEGDTTDVNGYFYITALPQGESGLNFSNISYLWATELSPQIEVTGGNHQHLGNIIFTTSTPAEISSFQVIPERHAILNIEHKNLNLINFHELYRADNLNGDGAKLVQIIESDITEIQVQEEVTDAFYALKSIPINGQKSPYSEWTHVPLVDVIDPDPAGSFFIYNNFFSATLNWQLTGYEDYYKGFRVVEDLDTGWAWVSPLLGVGTQSYQLNTEPGQTGNYYVLAISINDLYNTIQSEEQKIDLNVPSLLPPGNFDGRVQQDYSIRLFWEPVTNNDAWYGGYAIEKKVVTDSSTIDWEELTRIPTSVTSEFTDVVADSGNVYHYRISSVAYPPEPRGVFYSETDSISLSTK